MNYLLKRFFIVGLFASFIFSGCVHRPINIESNAKKYDLSKKRLYETVYLDHFSSSLKETRTLKINHFGVSTSSNMPLSAKKNAILTNEKACLQKLKAQNIKSIDMATKEDAVGAFFMQVTL